MLQFPPTLLDLSGGTLAPKSLAQSALILIDAQLEYSIGKLRLPHIAEATAELARLLELFRARGLPVVHVLHVSPVGRGLFERGTPFTAVLPELEPRAHEIVLEKRLPNSFAGTKLLEILHSVNVSQLVLGGFMTHLCVSTTARAALDLGFSSVVVANATATRALPDVCGGVISAEIVQRTALAELNDRFAAIVPSTDELASLA